MIEKIKSFLEGLDEYYQAPYRSALTKSYQEENDFFMLMAFAESLGVQNPASFYTIELLPFLLEEFHAWHKRMGMQHSPIEHFGCC
ncbi:cory-CC-star protein [Campylobacter sp. RM16190]|uniref:cory-CC-star protein n=1 Tax=Campylobacter sp. RM16190 TaxID=1705727 RepID=UPI0014735779|nr:cory-CC-star protein [Campylobacter sp. RM16190]